MLSAWAGAHGWATAPVRRPRVHVHIGPALPLAGSSRPLEDLEEGLAEAWSCAVRALGPAAPEDTPDDDGLVPTGDG